MKFELSDTEVENYKNFQKKMDEKYTDDEQYCGAAGGFYKISFIPTGLGDITDYDLF